MSFALAAALLGAVTITPAAVPAQGAQQAIVKLDHPAVVRIAAAGPGAQCELVDHVRGPFASAGETGKRRCELELLLDGGTYKLRLHAPKNGKGKLSLTATEFVELNREPVRLDAGMADTRELKPGEQLSYWIHQEERGRLFVRVYGRTAGGVRLWRAGEWLEHAPNATGTVAPRAGKPIYEWWIEPEVEAGDYLLVVDSARALRWAKGEESNQVHVVAGFDKPAFTRASVTDLPAWGSLVYDVTDASPAFGVLTRLGPSDEGATLLVGGAAKGQPLHQGMSGCTIERKALVPQCTASGGGERTFLVVRGEPGTPIRLQWGRSQNDLLVDGDYSGATNGLQFRSAAEGDYLVGVHDVPADRDAAPLSCELFDQSDPRRPRSIARDFLEVSPRRPFDRAFNYDGRDSTVAVDLTEWGYYTFQTAGDRKSRCELFAVEPTGERTRLTDSSADVGCQLKKLLKAGPYELKLYGGNAGIEKLRISGATTTGQGGSATKASCLFPKVHLDNSTIYRIALSRAGQLTGRGLILRPLPLALGEPLDLNLDAEQELRLPIGFSGAITARALSPEAKFACGTSGAAMDAAGGVCAPGSVESGSELILASRSPEPVALTVHRAERAPKLAEPTAYQPKIERLPVLPTDERSYFDFDREQARSLTFEVREAGLYDVATEGLLSTDCRIRTPVVVDLLQNVSGGRGRNCLLQAYLRPGRYLLTVKTTGRSKGRAAVVMTRRPPVQAEAVATGGEAFFRVPAGELIQEPLVVKARGKKRKAARAVQVELETTAQGARLSCRLDDADGWPVVRLPASCQGRRTLDEGRYLWTQLPLTVESMRHTRLTPVRPPLVLAGGRPHPIALNRSYVALLSQSGHDEFRFQLQAEMDVFIALTTRVQGRVYREEDGASATPIDLVPPDESGPPPLQAGEREEKAPAQPEEVTPSEGETEPSEGESTPSEGESGDEAPPPEDQPAEEAPPVRRRQPRRHVESAVPPMGSLPAGNGHKLHLPAGRYRLVTEHSRGDVAIRYGVEISAGVLAPGMSREVPVPLRATLRMPRAGTLRLNTEGDTDVRCRIFDAAGKLLAESAERGADWNCALAEPLPAGDLTLVLEARTLQAGKSRIALALAEEQEIGALAAAPRALELRKAALVADLPASSDAVQQIVVRSESPFSCALVHAPGGELVERQMETKLCTLLVRSRDPAPRYRVRLWSLEGRAKLEALARELRIGAARGRIPGGAAVRAEVSRDGRYQTGERVRCISATEFGPLADCGPEVSLRKGEWIFAALDAAEAELALREQVTPLEGERTERRSIARRESLERSKSEKRALHLLRVKVPEGDRAVPACALAGGVAAQRESTCFAAAGVVEESLARIWTAADAAGNAEVTWLAIDPPARAGPLPMGRAQLSWEGATGRFALPQEPARVELLLPAGAWAVQIDERGAAVDFCAPAGSARAGALDRCVLGGARGELYLYSPGEPRAASTAVATSAPSPSIELVDRYEERAAEPGVEKLAVKRGGPLTISGPGVVRCVIVQPDGARSVGCSALVEPGASVSIDRAAGPWRALIGDDHFAVLTGSGGRPLPVATSSPLEGKLTDRILHLESPALVHVHADSGVCRLSASDGTALDGLGSGCEIHRLLPAGDTSITIRGFAGEALRGAVHWTAEPVQELAEGVGPDSWIEPGGARLFRFQTRTQGGVGLGLRASADELSCMVMDSSQKLLGQGCQQLLQLAAGSYLLAVRAPYGVPALRFEPVLIGLQGAERGVPADYLRDFFARIGEEQ